MFTLDQIKAAHSKVKSGADFPQYIQDIISLGVKRYEAYVTDGHVSYHGADNYSTTSAAKYDALNVATQSNKEQFVADLKAHQQGMTDYVTFCADCARSGVEKWVVDTEGMTCIYYDKAGSELLVEEIPVP
jgi:uncharacterized protein YbcV (DUF1398 family)